MGDTMHGHGVFFIEGNAKGHQKKGQKEESSVLKSV